MRQAKRPPGVVTLHRLAVANRPKGRAEQWGLSVPKSLLRENPQLTLGDWYECQVEGKDIVFRYLPWDAENSVLIQD